MKRRIQAVRWREQVTSEVQLQRCRSSGLSFYDKVVVEQGINGRELNAP
ncbi:hypothetical protein ACNKHS_01560 [Shigella flexneri]